MKKLMAILFMFCLLLPVRGHQADAAQPIQITLSNGFSIFAEGAFVENGTTLLPLRSTFALLNAEVTWNAKTQTIDAVKGDRKIWLKIGSKNAKVNGQIVTLAVAPKIKNGLTYVPLRFVSEALGEPVEWEKHTNTIYIGFTNAPLGEPKSALPKGAYLTNYSRNYKDYGYTITLPSGGKITHVTVEVYNDGELDYTLIAYDKNGVFAMVNPSEYFGWAFTAIKEPNFSGEDYQIFKDIINAFRQAFE